VAERGPGGRWLKGQSPNPGGRTKTDRDLAAWREANAGRWRDLVAQSEIDEALLTWFRMFKRGDKDADWVVPYLVGPPPKPVEPKSVDADAVTEVVFRRLKRADGDGQS